ncbi:hypothetical protein SDIAM26S_02741 [Streptomyces diastaticus subsp. diastaticus]
MGGLGGVAVLVEGAAGGGDAGAGPGAGGDDLLGVAVQAQQQADLVPGGVLAVRGRYRERQRVGVVRVAGAVQRQGGHGVGEAAGGGLGEGVGARAGAEPVVRGERHLAAEQRDLVDQGVQPGRGEGRQARRVGAGPGQGQAALQQRPGLGRPYARAAPAGRGRAGEAVERGEQPGQPGRDQVFVGEDAAEPGQLGPQPVCPLPVQQRAEGVQDGAEAARRAAQSAGRLPGLLRVLGGLGVVAQRPQEGRGLGAQGGGDGGRRRVRARGRLGQVVRLRKSGHVGASARRSAFPVRGGAPCRRRRGCGGSTRRRRRGARSWWCRPCRSPAAGRGWRGGPGR